MAGGEERVLRRRIRSVQTTKKITKAMELIAASRIVRAQQRVAAARPYSDAITDVMANLAAAGAASSSPLLATPSEVQVVGFVVIGADRGFCGAYNASVIRQAEASMRAVQAAGQQYRLVCVGKKVESYFRFRRYEVAAAIEGTTDRPSYEDARLVASTVMPSFLDGETQQVELIYTQFFSAGTQRVVQRRLMPLDPAAITETAASGPKADYEYEPEPSEILDRLLPRYVEAKLFAAMLDASASEHAARQRAMASASDNADDLIVKLTRLRNRARQDAITTEIMEIVGGAEALAESATHS
jgi:F-type H+-transporting ATPase subunit gamma